MYIRVREREIKEINNVSSLSYLFFWGGQNHCRRRHDAKKLMAFTAGHFSVIYRFSSFLFHGSIHRIHPAFNGQLLFLVTQKNGILNKCISFICLSNTVAATNKIPNYYSQPHIPHVYCVCSRIYSCTTREKTHTHIQRVTVVVVVVVVVRNAVQSIKAKGG